MKTQLLCTFTTKKDIDNILEKIKQSYKIAFDKIYILQNEENIKELICTYNVETTENVDYNLVPNTISLHRKKHSNTLYTINALNELIKLINNGVLDTTYQVPWDLYKNMILISNKEGLSRIPTRILKIIDL